jgi:hypothetical protein
MASGGRIRVTSEMEGLYRKLTTAKFNVLFQNSPQERNLNCIVAVYKLGQHCALIYTSKPHSGMSEWRLPPKNAAISSCPSCHANSTIFRVSHPTQHCLSLTSHVYTKQKIKEEKKKLIVHKPERNKNKPNYIHKSIQQKKVQWKLN